MSENKIEVGCKGDGSIWVGFPEDLLIGLRSCLLARRLKAMVLSKEDASWLVGALRKELYGDPEDDVGVWMDDESIVEDRV